MLKNLLFLSLLLFYNFFLNINNLYTEDENIFLNVIKEIKKNIKYYPALKKCDITDKTILALIKKESGFDRFSVSNKGACGLMQVLPSTAKLYDKKITSEDLFNLKINIFIGIAYLNYLANVYNNKKEILQRYYWGNKKQLHYYYYWDIIRLENKIK